MKRKRRIPRGYIRRTALQEIAWRDRPWFTRLLSRLLRREP